MNGELWGLGRTWWVAVILIICSSVMLAMGSLDVGAWKEMVLIAFGVGAAKSTAMGVAGKLKQ